MEAASPGRADGTYAADRTTDRSPAAHSPAAHSPAAQAMAGPPDARAPWVAGHEPVRELGRGGSGTVWLVREAGTGHLCAAKLLGSGPGDPADAMARAQKEARIARARPHDHVLAVQRVAAADGAAGESIALLSEYAPGGSLGHLVGVRGRLPVGECITVVAPIAQALAALHAEGSAHGDVSPGNILFTADGRPMLGDFGLGRMVGDGAAAPAGTPGFVDPAARLKAVAPGGMAADALPLRRSAGLAAAGDVFSLGAIAWFILTGAPPVPTDQRPPLSLMVPDVPAELAAAIEAALRDEPRERPSAGELARSVIRSARPEPVDLAAAVDATVLPELLTRRQGDAPRRRPRARLSLGGAGRGRRTGRSRPAALWTAAIGLALLTAAAAWWWAGPAAPPHGIPAASEGARGAAGWGALPEPLRRAADAADPVQAVQALSEIRARAIAAGDRDLLEAVNAPGSEAAAADRALIDRLSEDGHRLEGFSARVLAASLEQDGDPAAAGSQSAVVRARILTSGYTVTDGAGARIGEKAAGHEQELRIAVERHAQRWKVAGIAAG